MGTSPHLPAERPGRPGRPGRLEILVAAGCAVVALAALGLTGAAGPEVATGLPRTGGAAWWVVVAVLLAQAVALCWVRLRARTVLVAVAAAGPVAALAGARDATSTTTLALVVAAYVAGTTRPLGTLVPSLAVVAVLVTAGGAVAAADTGSEPLVAVGLAAVQAVGTLALVLVVATWVRALREGARARADERRAVDREQRALVQAAVDRERTAMARELHDIAAHHLSGIAVVAAALERQVGSDPEGAREAARQVRRQSTSVLRDLRSLVGLLRDRDAATGARPETLAGIAELVAEVAATGRTVTSTALGDVEAAAAEVGPLAQLAAYRVVQEALANAARHAPGSACTVTLDARAGDAVVVVVRNGRGTAPAEATTGGGFGLVGMRERAQLTGADLEVGPTDDGGWQVRLVVPREGSPT